MHKNWTSTSRLMNYLLLTEIRIQNHHKFTLVCFSSNLMVFDDDMDIQTSGFSTLNAVNMCLYGGSVADAHFASAARAGYTRSIQ